MSTGAHMSGYLSEILGPALPACTGGPLEDALESPVCEDDIRDVRATLAGEEAAYRRLMERYQHEVYQQMWRFTRNRLDLDELVQEVFVQVYRSLARFRGDAPLLHWIRRIATRTGYRYWTRERRNRRDREVGADWAAQIAQASSSRPEAAGELLFQLLAGLPARDRLVLTLYYLEDCSAAEIALRMGWNATLVRVRVHRAIKKLQKRLEATGGRHLQ